MLRKTLLALALGAAFPAVFAQSTPVPQEKIGAPDRIPLADTNLATGASRVTIYGLLDGGIEYVNAGDVSLTRLQSGMSAGSRLGIRGSEDMGNGYRAIFTLEMRVEVDTGTTSNRAPIFYCGTQPYTLAAGAAPTAGPSCPGVTVLPPVSALAPPSSATYQSVLLGINSVNQNLLQAVTTVNSADALFDRQAFVGLVTPYGALLLGRQYTPGYEILNRFNSFADATAGQLAQGYSVINIRANNSIQYRAEAAGFVVSAMYGFGGSEGRTPLPTRQERTTAPTGGDDFWGANVQYYTPLFGVGVGYQQNYVVPYQQTSRTTGLQTLNVGGTLTLGPVRLFAQYMDRKNDNPILSPQDIQNIVVATGGNLTAITNILAGLQINPWDVDGSRGFVGPTDGQIYHLGAAWQIGPGTLNAAANFAKDTASSPWITDDAKVNHFAIAYFYNFSLRTQLYGAYAFMNNSGQARVTPGAAGYAGGWATSDGANTSALQVGLRHSF
jgi:predicted porin